jgi:hypothetical protein
MLEKSSAMQQSHIVFLGHAGAAAVTLCRSGSDRSSPNFMFHVK